MGHGWGNDRAGARRRAVGELVEIASCCRWGDEDTIVASLADLQALAWSPDQLDGFSDIQRNARAEWNAYLDGVDWIPPMLAPDRPIEWIRARELTQDSEVLVPMECVLIGAREAGDPDAVAVADTSGCAAGPNNTRALLSAIYEAIERDAVGRWWYGRSGGQHLNPDEIDLGSVAQRYLAGRGRHLWVQDITSNIAVPTMAAIAADTDGRHVSFGFATRHNAMLASHAAIGEMMLIELKTAMALKNPSAARELERWFREFAFIQDDYSHAASVARSRPQNLTAAQELEACLTLLSSTACKLAVLEFTRPCFGIPVYRVVSPDLCHWKPRFAKPRLKSLWSTGTDGHPTMATTLLRV